MSFKMFINNVAKTAPLPTIFPLGTLLDKFESNVIRFRV